MWKFVLLVSVASIVSASNLYFQSGEIKKDVAVQDKLMAIFAKLHKENKKEKVENVVCPDQQSQCPDGSTCCKLSTGQYGCCPLPNAVCCSDQIHCCPSGTTCDTGAGKCNRQDGTSVLWSKKTSSQSLKVENVVCPDQQSQCPDGSTCCKLSTGQYGCCPLPNAVCCSDQIHCCPSGTSCDTGAGKCNRQDGTSVMWSKKTSSQSLKSVDSIKPLEKKPSLESFGVMCPDGRSQCPNDNTCCKLNTGNYGCCPLPDAVCCADGVHCCPNGLKCDSSKGQCVGSYTTKLFTKSSAKKKISCCGTKCCPDGYKCTRSGLCQKLRNNDRDLFKNGF